MLTRFVLVLMVAVALVAFGTIAAGAGEGESAGGAKVSPIPTTWQELGGDLAVWTAAVFLVLLLVLWKFAWGPIVRGLNKRERHIADEIASAERSNAKARELLEEYQERLEASGEEVRQMLEAARRDAEKVGHDIVEKARGDAEAEHRRKLEEIEAAASAAIKEVAEQSATLAVELAGRIVAAELDPKDHSHLIEQAVSRFSARGRGDD